jgi:hypothetical protein
VLLELARQIFFELARNHEKDGVQLAIAQKVVKRPESLAAVYLFRHSGRRRMTARQASLPARSAYRSESGLSSERRFHLQTDNASLRKRETHVARESAGCQS